MKGTEYFDGKTSRYVDYPLTDVLQMIGRAGRPGFDTEGRAVVMVEESKKLFYKVRSGTIFWGCVVADDPLTLASSSEIFVYTASG